MPLLLLPCACFSFLLWHRATLMTTFAVLCDDASTLWHWRDPAAASGVGGASSASVASGSSAVSGSSSSALPHVVLPISLSVSQPQVQSQEQQQQQQPQEQTAASTEVKAS